MPPKLRAALSLIRRSSPPLVAGIAAAVAVACSAAPDQPEPSPASSAGSGGAPPTVVVPVVNPLGRARCRPPTGVSGSPKTTAEAVALLNALPKPTDVACFLESLDRPLVAYATSSVFSAQPAHSKASPRVFLKLGRLWLSAVIDGESSYLLEFGEGLAADPVRSIKGELELPVSYPVAPSAPYSRVRHGTGTICGLCHFDESPTNDPLLGEAFSSIAFRPRADTRVSVESLKAAAAACNWQVEPHRCDMLSAVFDGGLVVEEAFPDAMPTFF